MMQNKYQQSTVFLMNAENKLRGTVRPDTVKKHHRQLEWTLHVLISNVCETVAGKHSCYGDQSNSWSLTVTGWFPHKSKYSSPSCSTIFLFLSLFPFFFFFVDENLMEKLINHLAAWFNSFSWGDCGGKATPCILLSASLLTVPVTVAAVLASALEHAFLLWSSVPFWFKHKHSCLFAVLTVTEYNVNE